MSSSVRRLRLVEGLSEKGLTLPAPQVEHLVTFLDLLARWNRRMNLTAFDLESPSAAAIARLILEPVAASALVEPAWRTALDIGSGGGSPAIPLAICRPELAMTMIEVRERKGAFLREAVRVLGIRAVVETVRFEDWFKPEHQGAIDLVTIRAVRLLPELLTRARTLVSTRGAMVVFGETTEKAMNRFYTAAGPVFVARGPA